MGEICNACVLIVKRWRQLPLGTSKNWAHVVDARAGPGHNTKKMMVPVVLKPSVKKRPIEEVEEERSPKILRKMKKKKLLNKAEARVAKIEHTRAKRKNPEGVRRRVVGEQRSINNCTSGFIDFGYWRRWVLNLLKLSTRISIDNKMLQNGQLLWPGVRGSAGRGDGGAE